MCLPYNSLKYSPCYCFPLENYVLTGHGSVAVISLLWGIRCGNRAVSPAWAAHRETLYENPNKNFIVGAGNPNILYKASWVPVVHKQYLLEITENASCVESKPDDKEGIYSPRLFVQQTICVVPALERERQENQGFQVKGVFISN